MPPDCRSVASNNQSGEILPSVYGRAIGRVDDRVRVIEDQHHGVRRPLVALNQKCWNLGRLETVGDAAHRPRRLRNSGAGNGHDRHRAKAIEIHSEWSPCECGCIREKCRLAMTADRRSGNDGRRR